MTFEQREQVRLNALHWLATSKNFGLTTGLLLSHIRVEGFRWLTAEDLRSELEYLADPQKGLVTLIDKKISPENHTWKITAAGRDFLAQHET